MPTPGTPYLSQYMNPIPGRTSQATGGNPFASMLSSFGAGGSAGGQVSAAPSAPRFNAFLDPSQQNVFGFIGRLTGQPTREEFWAQRQGQAAHAGAAGLAERIKRGMPPQQAVVDFINSPEGVDFFTTVPNAADEIKNQLALMVSQPQDMINVAPGGTVFDPNTGQPAFNNPTTELQDFTGLAEVAQLDKDTTAQLAHSLLISKQTGNLTQTQQATQNLVTRGLISPEMKDKIDAGVVQVQPVLDPSGRTTGHVIIDLTDPTTPQVVMPGSGLSRVPVQPGDPSYAPGVADDGYDPDAPTEGGFYLSQFPNPADIVEGAGMIPAMTETLGGLAEVFVPGATGWGSDASKKRRALNQIRNDARSLKQSGRYLKDDIAVLDSVLPSTKTFTSESYTQAAESLISYRIFLEDRAVKATAEYNDPNSTGEARGKAKLELIDIEKAMSNVPTVDQLQAKIGELKEKYRNTSPALEGIKDIMQSGSEVEQKGKEIIDQKSLSPVQTEFKDEAEARRAVEANPEAYAGKTVTIGGKRMTVGVKKQPYTGGPK